jgi:hypothetical protein
MRCEIRREMKRAFQTELESPGTECRKFEKGLKEIHQRWTENQGRK